MAKETNKITIRALNQENGHQLMDYLSCISFEHVPHWSTCFCHFYHTNCDMKVWKSRTGEMNREASLQDIKDGIMKGYLAFSGEQVVGWLNANDAKAYSRLQDQVSGTVGERRLGLPICFVIHPDFRGQGIARLLLQRAMSDFRAKGFDGMLALPIDTPDADPQTLYRGPVKMYESLGFRHVEAHGELRVMRLNFEVNSGMVFHEIEMTPLSRKRKIRVWLPPGYHQNQLQYPVIYMHDGQNLFDTETAAYGAIWDAHLAIEQLMAQNPERFKGAIVVGIDNHEGLGRLDEYSPWISKEVEVLKSLSKDQVPRGGEGEGYGRFIIETLKPFIDANYRTNPERQSTYIAGSSMGGVISLFIGAQYPNVFAGVGAFSTAAWFAQEDLVDFLSKAKKLSQIKWYLDVGTKETSNEAIDSFNQLYIDGTEACKQALISAGVPESQLRVLVVEGGIHNERDWAQRLPEALQWLMTL